MELKFIIINQIITFIKQNNEWPSTSMVSATLWSNFAMTWNAMAQPYVKQLQYCVTGSSRIYTYLPSHICGYYNTEVYQDT